MSSVAGPLIERAAQFVAKKAESTWLNPLMTSAERVLREEGSMAVDALINLAKEGKMKGEQYKGLVTNAVKDDYIKVAKKGPAAAAEFNALHESGLIPKDVETGLAAVKAKNVMFNLHQEAKAVGIKTAPLVTPNYFPHMVAEGMFDTAKKRQEMIDHLIMTGQAANVAKASRMLGIQQGTEAPMRRVFHPLESPRTYQLDPKMIRRDLGVTYDYIAGAAERIGRARVFGPNGEKLEELLSTIHNVDGEAKYQMARRVVAEELGYTFTARPEEAGWERGMKAGLAATTLHLAPIANTLGGMANMITMMGLKDFVVGASKMAMNPSEAYAFADAAGPTMFRSMIEMKRLLGAENQSYLGKMSAKVLMNPAENMSRNERMMRVLGASVGKTAAESEFAKLASDPANSYARRRLNTLGIDVDAALRRGGLDASDKAKAAYVFSNKAMLSPSTFELPEMWRNSPWGRVITMYKPFLFLQTKFVRDEILKPAFGVGQKVDLRPLIWAAVTFPAFGEIAGDLKMLARGRDPNERPDFSKYPADRILDNISQIGGFGIASDVSNAMATGAPVQTYSFITGPVGSVTADALSLMRVTSTKAQADTLNRDRLSFFLRRIPVVGPITAQAVIPPKRRVPGVLQRGVVSKTLGLAK